MSITNNAGLHPAIVAAVENQDARWYSGTGEKRWASVTELIAPPTLTALKRAHASELEEEAVDCLWRLRGSALHRTVEELLKDDPRAVCEPRWSMEVAGRKITGGADIIWNGAEIIDLKDTSVWHLVYSDMMPHEYEEQLNLYRHMCPLPITRLTVVVFLRDWSEKKAGDRGYPSSKCLTLRVPVWQEEKAKSFLGLRVSMLESALGMSPLLLPGCTPEERWEKPTTYVVKKKGRKSAMSGSAKLETRAAAEAFIVRQGKKAFENALKQAGTLNDAQNLLLQEAAAKKCRAALSIEERPGARTRCEGYCPVAKWCRDYQASLCGGSGALASSIPDGEGATITAPSPGVKKDLWGCTVPKRKVRR